MIIWQEKIKKHTTRKTFGGFEEMKIQRGVKRDVKLPTPVIPGEQVSNCNDEDSDLEEL